jgi:23S rRNA (uridine2552-2'-O)-methyltransferase
MRPGGHFVGKVFQGPRFKALLDEVRTTFSEHRAFRPPSTRRHSREQYLVGRGLKASQARGRSHLEGQE